MLQVAAAAEHASDRQFDEQLGSLTVSQAGLCKPDALSSHLPCTVHIHSEGCVTVSAW